MIKILVIDDEEAILELVKRGLEKEGFAVDTLTSAKKVDVSKLRQYNLLILDVMMPDIDGFDKWSQSVATDDASPYSDKSYEFCKERSKT